MKSKTAKLWIATLVLTFVLQLVPRARAVGPCGVYEDPNAEHRSNLVIAGIAGGAGIVGIFFPPAFIVAALFGGLAAMNEGVMAYSSC